MKIQNKKMQKINLDKIINEINEIGQYKVCKVTKLSPKTINHLINKKIDIKISTYNKIVDAIRILKK